MSKGDRNVRTLQKERRKTRHTKKGGGDAVVFYARRVLSANNKVVKKVAFVHDDYSLSLCAILLAFWVRVQRCAFFFIARFDDTDFEREAKKKKKTKTKTKEGTV